MQTLIPIGFLNLGGPEIFLASLVALLLFGPRLPKVMRSLGKGIVEFKKGIRDTEDEINREIDHSASNTGPREIDHSTDDV
jgi:sec-independent protein translocase protein TatA